LVVCGCINPTPTVNSNPVPDSKESTESSKDIAEPMPFKGFFEILEKSDSVILASFISPNYPIKDPRTGKNRTIPFAIGEKLNDSSIQKRQRLKPGDIKELEIILQKPAVDDGVRALCFQPRNGIFAYKNSRLYYLIVCFDCLGYSFSDEVRNDIVFDFKKYNALLSYFKKRGFRYMLDD
jgi:hypothetical protein